VSAPGVVPPASNISSSPVMPWRPILLVWGLIMLLLLAVHWRAVPVLHMADPDDALRLVQVRDLLAGQPWFDLHQYRIMAPEGVLMHWSRLVDLPLAAVIVVLRPLLGQPIAEQAALIIVPALTLLAALALVMRTTCRLFDRDTAMIAGIVVGLTGPLLHQMQPLRIDHHGWQIVAALAALAAWHDDDRRRGSVVLGIALAAGLAISLEGLPLAVLFIAGLVVRDGGHRRWDTLARATAALAGASIVLFMALRGLVDGIEHCDAVSPMHLAAMVWAAAGCAALAHWRPRNLAVVAAVLAVVAIGAAGILSLSAPQCVGGAFGGMDPYVKSHWLDNVREGRPVWGNGLVGCMALIAAVPLGLLGCVQLLRRTRGDARMRWLGHGLILLGAALVGLLVSRAMITASALAILTAAWQLRQWRLAALASSQLGRRIAITAAMLLAVMPVIPAAGYDALRSRLHPKPQDVGDGARGCDFVRGLAPLDRLPATDVFAPLDIGPEILMRTHQRVVATAHHRGSAAIGDVLHGFMERPDQARLFVARRHAGLIVVCTRTPELGLYRRYAPQGLAATLLDGRPPAWLHPLPWPGGDSTGIAVWQVRQP